MLKVFALLAISVILLEALETNGVFEKYPIDGRVIGGHDADIKDYPYMLNLHKNGSFHCGAVLIADKWALTAAQCVFEGEPTLYIIRANSSLIDGGETIQVAKIIVHPNFFEDPLNSDIAILELSTPVTCTNCKAIPLGTTVPTANESATILGWGYDVHIFEYATTLQVAQVPVVERVACQKNFTFVQVEITENMLCAGVFKTHATKSCDGDYGGPLVIDGALYGLYSWGYCLLVHVPGVYTLVPKFLDWIRENTCITV